MGLFKSNLKRMEEKRDVEGLIRLILTEEDYRVCNAACEALGRIGLLAEKPLLMLLSHQKDNLRLYASYALSEVYKNVKHSSLPELALNAIYQSTSDPVDTVRQNAAFVLWYLGDANSIPFLIVMLEDGFINGRKNAAYALHEIATRIGDCPSFQPAYQPLLRMLQSDSDNGCRQNAAWTLGALANPIAIGGLTAALKDNHQPTRMNAVIGLKRIATPETMPGLVNALHDSNASVVKVACEALAALRLPEAIPALENTAKDRDPEVAQAANEALQAINAFQTNEGEVATGEQPIIAETMPQSKPALDEILSAPLLKWDNGQFICAADSSIATNLNDEHHAALSWFQSQNFYVPDTMGDEFAAEYLFDMGLQAQQAGVLQEAWGGLHAALGKYLTLGNLQKVTDCYYSLGQIYGVKQDLRLANVLFRQAVYCTHSDNRLEKEAWALTYLGIISSDLGQNSLAREALEKAHMLFQQTDPAQVEKVAKILAALPAESGKPVQADSLSTITPANLAAINEAISKLSLRPRELELLHPEKADAIEFLKTQSTEAVEPMLAALRTASDAAYATLLYLLGETHTQVALRALEKALSHTNTSVRYEAIIAIRSYPDEALRKGLTSEAIQSAAEDPDEDVRKVVREISDRLGNPILTMSERHWAEGAATWENLSKAFIRSQIMLSDPDFKGLSERLKPFIAGERHGAWIRVAQELERSNPTLAIGCYVEALVNDPDPNSIAWQWLSGVYNPRLRVLEPSQPHTKETIAELNNHYGILK